jgi:hypothetical protein
MQNQPEHEFKNLENRTQHRRRLKWTAKRIDDTTALTAYMAFTAGQDDDDLELLIGRLLVLLDRAELLDEER